MLSTTPSVLAALSRDTVISPGVAAVTAAGTAIETINPGLCVTGQLLLVTCQVQITKGGVAGATILQLAKLSGTATIEFGIALDVVINSVPSQPAGSIWYSTFTAIGRIAAPGSLVLRLLGQSIGSDGVIVANAASIGYVRINR